MIERYIFLQIESCDKIFITPDQGHWNPYCESFSLNEESMVNYNGDLVNINHHTNYLMDIDQSNDEGYVNSVLVADAETTTDDVAKTAFHPDAIFTSYNCDKCDLANALNQRAEISKMMTSIGSVREEHYLKVSRPGI